MPMILLVVVGAIKQSKICANDVIGCGGDINQSDFVSLRGSTQVYAGLRGGLHGSTQRSMRVYVEVYAGLCRGLGGSMQGST